MTDKVQKIKEWVKIRKQCTMAAPMKFYCKEAESDYNMLCTIEKILDSLQEEPVSDDLAAEVEKYLEAHIAGDYCIERDSLKIWGKGIAYYFADWQNGQMMENAVDVTIAIPYQNSEGGYTQLVDSKKGLPFGDNIKVLVIKED